jgi:glucose-6-phosphate isomerase
MITNQNPTQTSVWKQLEKHAQEMKSVHMNDLFKQNPNRTSDFSVAIDQLQFDYSKNRITDVTMAQLVQLAKEVNLPSAIHSLFGGEKINTTEKRAVLHTALREFKDYGTQVDGDLVYPLIHEARVKVQAFTEKVINGAWKGYTGKSITDVVNIGIGGSDLGPQMVVEALDYYRNHLNVHFISNVDGDAAHAVLRKLNPETTLFVVVSKTFTTIETLTNATTCKNWLLQTAPESAVKNHFVAVSTNEKAISGFGIDLDNAFPMWDWVGGRFSMWSSVGIAIALALGYDHFESFLQGAHAADEHFKSTELNQNIPVLMGLLTVWYANFHDVKAQGILPYAESLNKLVSYLQQLFMESNGKSVDRNGQPVTYQTGTVIFGTPGTNAQHSFMQHIHQGTQLVPIDFIGFEQPLYGDLRHHQILMANFQAQSAALQEGKSKEAVHLSMKVDGKEADINALIPFKVFEGNRVSNTLVFEKLTPYTLGMLIALYEHKVFVEGVVWNINSFDQFGVELGKEMAKRF